MFKVSDKNILTTRSRFCYFAILCAATPEISRSSKNIISTVLVSLSYDYGKIGFSMECFTALIKKRL